MHLEEAVITDFVDETLAAGERDAVERHLAGCVECRRLVDDFREIRRIAGSLEERQPPARAWARLDRAIKLEQQHADASRPRTGFAQWMGFAAAAAVLVIATAAGLRYLMTTRSHVDGPGARTAASSSPGQTSTQDAARAQASAAAIEAELRAAEEHYDKAIKGLETIASAEQGAL